MIGKAIEHYIKVKGLTQAKLSEMTDISPSAINQYVKGARNPSPKNLELISNALEVPISRLNETAESFRIDSEKQKTDENIRDERMLQRRLDFIYGQNDIVLELSKYVLIGVKTRTHDLVHEINERKSRPARRIMSPRDKVASPIEAITEKVLREVLTENLDEIAYRIQEEMKRTELTIDEIIENIRNQNEY